MPRHPPRIVPAPRPDHLVDKSKPVISRPMQVFAFGFCIGGVVGLLIGAVLP